VISVEQASKSNDNGFTRLLTSSHCGLLITAQPETPAFMLAGASGWAVND
jgi:hypothetical protein